MNFIDVLLRRVCADAPQSIAGEIRATATEFDDGETIETIVMNIEGDQLGWVNETEAEPAIAHAASLLQDYVADTMAMAWPELEGTGVLDVRTTAQGIAAWVRGDEIKIPVGELRAWLSAHRRALVGPGA